MKPRLYTQQRMDENVVPLPEKTEQFHSFKEMFESSEVSDQWKLNWIGQVSRFMTLNSITKADLHAALKWLFEQEYVYE